MTKNRQMKLGFRKESFVDTIAQMIVFIGIRGIGIVMEDSIVVIMEAIIILVKDRDVFRIRNKDMVIVL